MYKKRQIQWYHFIGKKAIKAEISTNDNGGLSLKTLSTKTHKISWDQFSSKQYVYFFSYYACLKGQELNLKPDGQSLNTFKSIAEFYFASALWSDWYGFQSVAQQMAKKAISLDPALTNKELITFR